MPRGWIQLFCPPTLGGQVFDGADQLPLGVDSRHLPAYLGEVRFFISLRSVTPGGGSGNTASVPVGVGGWLWRDWDTGRVGIVGVCVPRRLGGWVDFLSPCQRPLGVDFIFLPDFHGGGDKYELQSIFLMGWRHAQHDPSTKSLAWPLASYDMLDAQQKLRRK